MLLKIVAFMDDPQRRVKDLDDIRGLLPEYEAESDRLFSDVVLDAALEDVGLAPAFLLGTDLRKLCSPEESEIVRAFLAAMNEDNPAWMSFVRARGVGDQIDEDARDQLKTLRRGFEENAKSLRELQERRPADAAPCLERLREPSLQKFAQLGCSLELGHGIEPFERAREGVGQAPHGSCRELGVFRLEILVMDLGQQALGSVQLTIDEGRVENQLRLGVGDLRLLPVFDLALHRLEVPLDAVHTYRERVDQVEALAVLGQDWREIAAEGHIRADKHADADRQSQPQRFVVRVADAD